MKNIVKIIQFARPFHKYLYFISGLIFILTILELVSPYFIKLIVDQIELQVKSGQGNINEVYIYIFLLFVFSFFSVLLDATNQRIGDFTTARIGRFLTEKFYKKIFTLPQAYFDSQISGKIVNQLGRGIIALQDFLGASTNFVVPAFIRCFFIIVILSFYSIPVAILVGLIFPLYIYISHYSTKKWGLREVEKNQIEDVTRGRIQEVIANIKLVKSYNRQRDEWNFVSERLGKSVSIYDKQSTTYHVLNFLRNFGLEIGLVLISIIVFKNTFAGILSLGEMVLIIQYLNQIRRPLFAMSFILERIQKAESGSKEYFEVLALESPEKFPDEGKLKVHPNTSIKFEDVSFEYPESGLVLKDLNFELSKKETVALVGHSGAGKSTIINLILKFYEPTKGSIYMGTKKYTKLNHEEIRSQISLVFQESELFSTTIFENVAYGMKDAKKSDVVDALKKANAYEFVMQLSNQLDTKIGESGVRLSGGQKQRIQIARAILSGRPILILDEATSSLDAKSEKSVQDALDNLMQDRLTIVIAHRFSTIQNADKILVIDGGKIVDSGSPSKLGRQKGIYSELLRYQIEGNQRLLEKYDLN